MTHELQQNQSPGSDAELRHAVAFDCKATRTDQESNGHTSSTVLVCDTGNASISVHTAFLIDMTLLNLLHIGDQISYGCQKDCQPSQPAASESQYHRQRK